MRPLFFRCSLGYLINLLTEKNAQSILKTREFRGIGFMETFHKLVDTISRIVKIFVLICAASIFAIILFTVVSRYGFSWVLSWSEEVPRYLLIWVSFLSAAVGVDISDSHIPALYI